MPWRRCCARLKARELSWEKIGAAAVSKMKIAMTVRIEERFLPPRTPVEMTASEARRAAVMAARVLPVRFGSRITWLRAPYVEALRFVQDDDAVCYFVLRSRLSRFTSCLKGARYIVPLRVLLFLLQLYGHGFDFGVVGEAVFAEFAANAGLLEAAEGSRSVEHVVAVDPDGAGANRVRDGVGLGDVLGPDRGGQAVHIFVGALDDFAEVRELENGHDRAEDFFLGDLHVVLHVRENGGLDE